MFLPFDVIILKGYTLKCMISIENIIIKTLHLSVIIFAKVYMNRVTN